MKSRKRRSEVQEERRRRTSSTKKKHEIITRNPLLSQLKSLQEEIPQSVIQASCETSQDVAMRIGNEFRTARTVFLMEYAFAGLKIQEMAICHFINLIHSLKYARHEKEWICTSILVLGEGMECEMLGEKSTGARPGLTIADTDEVAALAACVADGFTGTLVMRSNGQVLGNYLFRQEGILPEPFLPKRYWKAANTSRNTKSLLCLFKGDGRVSMFYCGQLILSHRDGKWHPHSDNLKTLIKLLSHSYSIDASIIQGVLRIAFRMSDESLGALITVGDHIGVLKISDPPKTKHLYLPKMMLGNVPDDAMIGLMGQDGATIFASNGSFMGAMAFLRPPPGIQVEQEIGRGSKHDTAAKASIVTKAFCVTVSVDGRITIYSYGVSCWIEWI